jgi:hypothetical protein
MGPPQVDGEIGPLRLVGCWTGYRDFFLKKNVFRAPVKNVRKGNLVLKRAFFFLSFHTPKYNYYNIFASLTSVKNALVKIFLTSLKKTHIPYLYRERE